MDSKDSLTLDGRLERPKKGKSHVQNMGIFFGDLGHGPESSRQISANYKFFPDKSYFYRTIIVVKIDHVFVLGNYNRNSIWDRPTVPILAGCVKQSET